MIFIIKIISHYFHVLKCLKSDCSWDGSIRSGEIETFRESVPPVHGCGGELHNV